jgi:hypothetical protein
MLNIEKAAHSHRYVRWPSGAKALPRSVWRASVVDTSVLSLIGSSQTSLSHGGPVAVALSVLSTVRGRHVPVRAFRRRSAFTQ